MKTTSRLLAAVLAVAILAGAAGTGAVLAQETTTPSAPLLGHRGGMGMRGGMWNGGSWESFDAAAEALGLTPEQLFAELRSGKSLSDIAEAKGIELDTVKEAMEAVQIAARKTAIEQAVTDGTLTREQADWLLKGIELGFTSHGRGRMVPNMGLRGSRTCPETETTPSTTTVSPSTTAL